MGSSGSSISSGLRNRLEQVPLGRRDSGKPLHYKTDMKIRTRKFIGMVLTVGYMAVYSLVVMAFGGVFVLGHGRVFELAFYVIGGLAWLPIEMVIIRWMSKPDPI
jgi:Protein of unknown function (DUF2842)